MDREIKIMKKLNVKYLVDQGVIDKTFIINSVTNNQKKKTLKISAGAPFIILEKFGVDLYLSQGKIDLSNEEISDLGC